MFFSKLLENRLYPADEAVELQDRLPAQIPFVTSNSGKIGFHQGSYRVLGVVQFDESSV